MNMVSLEDCCEILDSMRVPITASKREEGEYPYYGANGVQDYVSEYLFDDELVLLAEDGGNFGSKDKPIAYRVSGKCWVNNHAHVLKPNKNMNVDYLCYSLMFYNVSGMVNGATRKKLTQAAMRKMQIPLRKMEEQLHIVQQLNSIITIKKLQEQEISLFDELIKARFVELFGDMETNFMNWDTYNFGECFEIASSKRILKSEWKTEGIPFLRVRDMVQLATTKQMNNEFFVSEQLYSTLRDSDGVPKEGDILVSATSTLGKCYIVGVGERYYFKDADILRFRCKKEMNPIYFVELMKTSYIKRQIAKTLGVTTVAHFTIKAAKAINMRTPPIELQNQFAAFVAEVDKSKLMFQKLHQKLNILQQKAGDI